MGRDWGLEIGDWRSEISGWVVACLAGWINGRDESRAAGDGSAFPLGEQGEEIQDIRTQREAGHLDTDALCDVVTGGEIHDAEEIAFGACVAQA
jgi:hypothetical protein